MIPMEIDTDHLRPRPKLFSILAILSVVQFELNILQ